MTLKTLAAAIAIAIAPGLATIGGAWAQANTPAPKPLAKKEVVKVALTSRLEAFAPVLVGVELGEFAKENLEVEYVTARVPEILVLLSTGQADASLGSPTGALFNAIAQGSEIRVVGPGMTQSPDNKQGFYMSTAYLAGRPYSPALFKGQEIGSVVGYGGTVFHYLQKELEKANLSLKDIRTKTIGAADIVTALESGAINVGFVSDPHWTKFKPGKVQYVLGTFGDFSPGSINYGKRFITDRRDLGEAFMRAIVRTVRTHLQGDMHKNPTVMAALSKIMSVPVETLTGNVAPTFPAEMALPMSMAADLQKTYFLTPGVLSYDKPLPNDKVIDTSFLDKAKKG